MDIIEALRTLQTLDETVSNEEEARYLLQDADLLTSKYIDKPSYILPTGEFVDSSKSNIQNMRNGTTTCHNMICKILGIDGYVNSSLKPVLEWGWVRYNPFKRYNYIELPDNKPTPAQMESIIKTCDMMLISNGFINIYMFDPEYSENKYKIVSINNLNSLKKELRKHYGV